MSKSYMDHVRDTHGPCSTVTWAMSLLDMAHVGMLHGPCQLWAWTMLGCYLGHVTG